MNPQDTLIHVKNEDGYIRIDGKVYATLMEDHKINLFQFVRGLEDAHRQLKSAQEVVDNMQRILDRHLEVKILEEA